MNLARIRKAITAGLTTGIAVVWASLQTEIPRTQPGWVGVFTAGVVAAFAAGWATYKVRNEGTVNGSDTAAAAGRPPVAPPVPPSDFRDGGRAY